MTCAKSTKHYEAEA